MEIKRSSSAFSALAAGVSVAALGLGASGDAEATAIAYATNQLTGFSITSTADFAVVGTPTRNTINSAQYTGFPADDNQDPQVLGAASDAAQATSGPGPFPGANDYSFLAGSVLGMAGARADSNTTAQSPFSAGGVNAVNNVAEARVLTGSDVSGNSSGRNSAEASFVIELMGAGTFTFAWEQTARYFASSEFSGESANGTIANSYRIADASTGTTIFTFSPDGVLNLAAGETADDFNLNTGCGSNSGIPLQCDSGLLSGDFSATSQILQPGLYSVSLLTNSTANVVSALAVPEPTSLLLLSTGLFGLGVFWRRRGNTAG